MRKTSKNKTAEPVPNALFDRLPKDRGEYLELLIRFTERYIVPNHFDSTMANQAKRLKSELQEWKKQARKSR